MTDLDEDIYNALILNDYPGAHYATMVHDRTKIIETRMKQFKYRGDLIICCGNGSVSKNKGKALCMVNLFDARPMTDEDEPHACISNAPGRIAHLLKDWRYFNRQFHFAHYRISGSYQSIFQLRLPDDVRIISNSNVA